jgi:hypothetical protein
MYTMYTSKSQSIRFESTATSHSLLKKILPSAPLSPNIDEDYNRTSSKMRCSLPATPPLLTSSLCLPFKPLPITMFKRRANSSHVITKEKNNLHSTPFLTPRRLLLYLRCLLTRPGEHGDSIHLLQPAHRGLRSVLPPLTCLLIDERRLSERVRASRLRL